MTENTLRDKVEKVITETIAPALASHGGGIELVDVAEDSGIVSVRLQGACSGCPGAMQTLKSFVESHLMEAVPAIKAVEPVQ